MWGRGGGVVTGRPSDYRWGVADLRQVLPPHAVARWWDGTGVLLDSEQLAHPSRAGGRREDVERREQSERDQEDVPWDKEEERARPPGGTSLRVLPHLLTCIASFNLPSPGELGTLSAVCSEGTGAQSR